MQEKLFRPTFFFNYYFFSAPPGRVYFLWGSWMAASEPPSLWFSPSPSKHPFLSVLFQKEPFFFLFFCPPSPVFLRVVISLRLPMVFNSSFMLGAFYKLYSHGLLTRPPTDPACLNSICLHPRHIQPARNGLNPAFFPPFLPPSSCPPAKPGWESRRGHRGGVGVLLVHPWVCLGSPAGAPSLKSHQISPQGADALLVTGAYLTLIPNALSGEFDLAFWLKVLEVITSGMQELLWRISPFGERAGMDGFFLAQAIWTHFWKIKSDQHLKGSVTSWVWQHKTHSPSQEPCSAWKKTWKIKRGVNFAWQLREIC